MRFLLTLAMICVLFGVSYSQTKQTVFDVGKDSDGDTWYLDTETVARVKPPADWAYVMPLYFRRGEGTIVIFFNVDCTDSTIQPVRSVAFVRAEVIDDKWINGRWTKWSGWTGRGAQIVCGKFDRRLPIINSLEKGKDG